MTVDDALLALLYAVPEFHKYVEGEPATPGAVFDGSVQADETLKVISVPLPYVVYWSSPGYDRDERFCGSVNGRVLEFSVTGVGSTPEQAKWVLDKARAALSRKRLNGRLIRRDEGNDPIRRDDDYTRPGGGPLFYGIDQYAVGV